MFVNGMIHGSGLYVFMRTTVDHQHAFTFSNYTLEAFLSNIQLIKVTGLFLNSIADNFY